MKGLKFFPTRFLITVFVLTIYLTAPSFAITVATNFTVTGMVENIGKDAKFIVVNKTKIFITQDTKIADENGKYLARDSLRTKDSVTIEVVQRPEGLFAQKVIVKTAR